MGEQTFLLTPDYTEKQHESDGSLNFAISHIWSLVVYTLVHYTSEDYWYGINPSDGCSPSNTNCLLHYIDESWTSG